MRFGNASCTTCSGTGLEEQESFHTGSISYYWCECSGRPRYGQIEKAARESHDAFWTERHEAQAEEKKNREVLSQAKQLAFNLGQLDGVEGRPMARDSIAYMDGYREGCAARTWEKKQYPRSPINAGG